MSKLLQAAKAVIEEYYYDRCSETELEFLMKKLRAAVKQAEKQEAVGFEEWWHSEKFRWNRNLKRDVQAVWTAAQRAERERIRAKAETFFKWPSDRRDVVTLTSCILFARQCIVDTAAENICLRQAIEKTIADNLEVCTLIDLKRAVNWDGRELQE